MPSNTDIEVIGKGNIGNKARQLLEKTSQLREIGFHTPRRVVFAENYFDEFFQRNNLGNNLQEVIGNNLEEKIKKGSLSRNEFEILQGVVDSFGGRHLAIRSSAQGDSRGTGTYKTSFSVGSVGRVKKAMRDVLASYFSEDATLFRKDAGTGEGFGIIVEPLIGNDFDFQFAPILSGFGYTSTSRGEGYINAVPGLGGGVESRDGEKITESSIKPYRGDLTLYLMEEFQKMVGLHRTKPARGSALLQTESGLRTGDSYTGLSFFSRENKVENTSFHFGDHYGEKRAGEIFNRLNLNPFFEKIKRLENVFGQPQYFEWAMTEEGETPRYWITQIADISKKLDLMDFGSIGTPLITAHTVTGTGVQRCYKIADCWNPKDIGPLHEFNRNNKDYVLLYGGRLTSSALAGCRKLSYNDFSNASVFLEIQDVQHTGTSVSHLGGQLDMTGKFFGVVDYDAEVRPNFEKIHSREKDVGRIKVYHGKMRVISSERQNKLVVSE